MADPSAPGDLAQANPAVRANAPQPTDEDVVKVLTEIEQTTKDASRNEGTPPAANATRPSSLYRFSLHGWLAKNDEFVISNVRRLLSRRARIFLARHRNRIYVWREKALALLLTGNDLKVLISAMPDWMGDIQGGFRRTRYVVKFDNISSQELAGFDVVVPLYLGDIELSRTCSGSLRKNKMPLPSDESIRLCNDKLELCHFLIRAGFEAYIPETGRGLKPPYILKKRIGYWGMDCYIIRDPKDEQALSQQLNDPGFFCQQLIFGSHEFATHILFRGGRIVKALNIMYEFETETPIKGPTPSLYKVIHRCPYLELFARILQTIQFEGLCCVNYKVADGRLFLLEINPRFGGSLSPYFFSFLRHLR